MRSEEPSYWRSLSAPGIFRLCRCVLWGVSMPGKSRQSRSRSVAPSLRAAEPWTCLPNDHKGEWATTGRWAVRAC